MYLLLIKYYFIAFVSFIILVGCSSSTIITTSNTDTTEVYINGEYVGNTPYNYTDKLKGGSSTLIQLEKEGYHSYYGRLKKKWFGGYTDTLNYKMIPETSNERYLDSKNQNNL